jgi:protein-L-isoaspartate(D-aspartate) O-methyltransferase
MQSGRFRGCELEVSAVLQALRTKRAFYKPARKDVGQGLFSAVQNARLVSSAERYYRTMYIDRRSLWNLRDQHMFETLQEVLNHRGPASKAVVWAHNLHIGDARATEMSLIGDFNLGQQVRETFGNNAYLVGFGTAHGTVAAATEWGRPMQVMRVPPAHRESYERVFHDVQAANFLLPLRHPWQLDITRKRLLKKRLQRAIGVVYNPQTDLVKNYSYTSLPRQFDEYIWFDKTRAVKPLTL